MTEQAVNLNAGRHDETVKSPPESYGAVAVALHWIIALAMAGTVVLAWDVMELDAGDERTALLAIHKSVGTVILALAAIRLAWRIRHPAPAYAVPPPAWQRRAAHAAHGLLYVLMIAMPVTGYISEAARARNTDFFGLVDIPRLVPLDRKLSFYAQTAHSWSQYLLYALIAAHVGAALYHQFVLRDRLLERMLPRKHRPQKP